MRSTERTDRIGAALVEARAARVPWKVLMCRFGYSRAYLNRLYRRALAGGKDVSSSNRRHLRDCKSAATDSDRQTLLTG